MKEDLTSSLLSFLLIMNRKIYQNVVAISLWWQSGNNKLNKQPVIAFFSKSCDIIIYICCCEMYVETYTIYIYVDTIESIHKK